MATDIQTVIGEIAARNHLLIEHDDPIFAVSTMHRLMLEESIEGMIARVGVAIAAFEKSARAVDAHSGKLLAQAVQTSASAWKEEIARDMNLANARCCELMEKIHVAHGRSQMLFWLPFGIFAGLILFSCGILCGLYVR